MDRSRNSVFVVVPNWNGAERLAACLDSLLAQSLAARVVVVDNGSVDGSLALLEKYPAVEVIRHSRNLGFAGGVNAGFRRAIEEGADYVAAFNNDAVADKRWLEELVKCLAANPAAGIAACKLLSADGRHLDSTGDYYTVWGLPYPRGRGEAGLDKYDSAVEIFGASGGASLYRVAMLQAVGLFDEDFFAYYEDVDLSFRAQLAGWKVRYAPAAVAYHAIGATSGQIKGFATYQTVKNLPMLFWKNVPPGRIFISVLPRFTLAYLAIIGSALRRGQVWPVAKGWAVYAWLLPKKLAQRYRIQRARQVSKDYIWSLLIHDLPPNARALRRLRAGWRKRRCKP